MTRTLLTLALALALATLALAQGVDLYDSLLKKMDVVADEAMAAGNPLPEPVAPNVSPVITLTKVASVPVGNLEVDSSAVAEAVASVELNAEASAAPVPPVAAVAPTVTPMVEPAFAEIAASPDMLEPSPDMM